MRTVYLVMAGYAGIVDCYGVYDWADGARQRRDELKKTYEGMEAYIAVYPLIEEGNNKGFAI